MGWEMGSYLSLAPGQEAPEATRAVKNDRALLLPAVKGCLHHTGPRHVINSRATASASVACRRTPFDLCLAQKRSARGTRGGFPTWRHAGKKGGGEGGGLPGSC